MKRNLSILLTALVCTTAINASAIEQDASGYYLVTTPEELCSVSSVVNAGNSNVKIRLVNDLDMSSITNFPSIGIFDWPSGPQVAFQGEFDGQGHIIYNLTIDNTSDAQETGLFGRVNGGGYIHDFGVVNAKITANSRAGVVAGEIHDCTVDNVFTAGDLQVISNNTAQHGGLSGEGANSTFNNCYTTFNGPLTNIPERLNNCYWGQDAIEKALTGELCYRLNGNDYRKPVWFQSIDQDEYPILDSSHGIVYPIRDGEFASATSLAEKAKMVNRLYEYATVQARKGADPAYSAEGNSTYGWTVKADEAVAAGIPLLETICALNAFAGMTADKDEDGKTITGSKKAKVCDYIDELDLTVEQKDLLYLLSGYKENSLPYTPWHGWTEDGSGTSSRKGKSSGKRSRRSGGGRSRGRSAGKSSGSVTAAVTKAAAKGKTSTTDYGIEMTKALFGGSSAGSGKRSSADATGDLVKIVDRYYNGNVLLALADGGRKIKGRTKVDFKL